MYKEPQKLIIQLWKIRYEEKKEIDRINEEFLAVEEEVKRDYEELKKLDTGFFKRIKNWLSFKNRLDDIYTERNHQIQEIRDIYQVKYNQFDASIFWNSPNHANLRDWELFMIKVLIFLVNNNKIGILQIKLYKQYWEEIYVKIILDTMGGDNAPDANIKGAVKAVNKVKAEIVLVGKEEVIRAKVKEFYGKEIEEISDRLKIKNATETIEMEDQPTVAIKHKKDSSMVVGFNMLKADEGDVFISAGNSGALLAGATLLVGRIKGIDRPALAGILPAYKSQLLLMDCGSNTNCKPINLLQFAQMSTIYLRNTFGIEKPAIGLLNIGTEETKGNELVKESYQLLKEKSEELGINFVGNVEGRDAFSGEIDAIVTDGFTGNVFLKTTEGLGKFVKRSLKESLFKSVLSKIATVPALPAMSRFSKVMDYKSYGGALFLGVKKPVVKAHGSSDEKLFEYTIIQAEKFVENKAVDKMIEAFSDLSV